MAPSHIAIIGGGLTGLSSAFHLTRRFPNALVTVLERNPRLGGWVRSERVQVQLPSQQTASVLFESGPRTLRPTSKAVLELIHLLNLSSQLVTTSKSSPAARARFLHVAPTPGLVALPTSPRLLLRSPLFPLLLSSLLREPFRSKNRPPSATGWPEDADESLDSFFTRRFGAAFARVLGSALTHGVYAADSRDVSVRAAFPVLYELEERGGGSVALGAVKGALPSVHGDADVAARSFSAAEEYDLGTVPRLMKHVAVFSFRDGMQTLTNALVANLQKNPNVRLYTDVSVTSLKIRANNTLKLYTPSGNIDPSHVVSAVPLPVLQTLISANTSHRLPYLTANPTSSVTIVNLLFAQPPHEIHPAGFGYLVPRPLEDYPYPDSTAPRTLGILGTVFDSCSLSAQDAVGDSQQPAKAITKMTVMLGGPYLGSSTSNPLVEDPSFLPAVLAELERHLDRKLPEPVFHRVVHNASCIPTPTPGHLLRMGELRAALEGEGWEGRMEVVGAGVGGVSIGKCVEAGRNVGAKW